MLHVKDYLVLEDLPMTCIIDCSVAGDVSKNVRKWRKKLGFSVERAAAIRYLEGFGAWDDLHHVSDETLSERVLWLACSDFKDYLVEKADNPNQSPRFGTDIVSFV